MSEYMPDRMPEYMSDRTPWWGSYFLKSTVYHQTVNCLSSYHVSTKFKLSTVYQVVNWVYHTLSTVYLLSVSPHLALTGSAPPVPSSLDAIPRYHMVCNWPKTKNLTQDGLDRDSTWFGFLCQPQQLFSYLWPTACHDCNDGMDPTRSVWGGC